MSGEPLDELDLAILGQVRAAHDRADPPPADLNDRVRFALRLADADIEVFRRHEDNLAGAGARTSDLRTITFESERLTIMLTVAGTPEGAVRLDGWLAPAQPLRVELRLADGGRETVADADGRFAFAGVPAGLAQLVVHRGSGRLLTAPIALSAGG